ncbi:DUF2225 domain-containing protein [Butyrivibrio sp. CB08]|uniref:DUF2225 domain-containing protein n=1 Tax=Butyrivibrio sp. CB08 TaxID=2364879 RepID=UPI000EA86B58|nr:DUF2225 domain-containing protein [Butyrivibrio sp. CB08]RKM60533.1 DUF2225 domain-containing protein [Butyrivibrio sp. CB08]
MAGIFSGFDKLGLGNLGKEELFEDPKKKVVEVKKDSQPKKLQLVNEEDYLFDKKYKCPVCESDFEAKTVRTGKVRMKNVDIDLRPDYDELDQNKYDVIACPACGYAALGRYFPTLNKYQIDDIRVKICMNYKHEPNREPVYSYEYARRLYQLALANAVVKKAKNSEKAYICMKTAWVIRGETQRLDPDEEGYEAKKKENDAQEKELLENALNGFIMARQSEEFPIAGMDSTTLDYLIAALAVETGQREIASKMISDILVSRTANSRIKDKARFLKEMLAEG